MSTIQDNPFKQSDDQVYGEEAPPTSNKKGCLIGCGIAGLLGLLVCCGGAFFMYSQASNVITQAMGPAFSKQLATEPNVQDLIGEIESFDFDMTKTIEDAQKKSEQGGEANFAFRIKGSKGSGIVLIPQDSANGPDMQIRSGTLVMDDGTEIPLDVEAMQAAGPGNTDIDIGNMVDEGDASDPGATNDDDPGDDSSGIEVDPGPLSP